MKEFFKNKKAITAVLLIGFVIVLPVVFFLGVRYLAPLLIIALIYVYLHSFKYEDIVSPKEFNELKDYLRELEEREEMIKEHLEEHGGDLDAKFELRNVQKEVEEVKKEMGL